MLKVLSEAQHSGEGATEQRDRETGLSSASQAVCHNNKAKQWSASEEVK